jgi:hypothetical protein
MQRILLTPLFMLLLLSGCKSKVPYSVLINFFDVEDVHMITGQAGAPSISGKICVKSKEPRCLKGNVTLYKDSVLDVLYKNRELILDLKDNKGIMEFTPAVFMTHEYYFSVGNCQFPLSPSIKMAENEKVTALGFRGLPYDVLKCTDDEDNITYNGSRRQKEIQNESNKMIQEIMGIKGSSK